jgi:Fe-S oxidoreductase
MLGFAARRALPVWRSDIFRPAAPPASSGKEVVLLADTFNRYFEPENLRAAEKVLTAAGYRVEAAEPVSGGKRPLCCGRTFLAAGLVEEARSEARRMLAALAPFAARGVAIVGLEPSCLLTLRDELPALLPGKDAAAIAGRAVLFEEFLAEEAKTGGWAPDLKPVASQAYLHGHCHQKSFGAMGAVEKVLRLVPGLAVKPIASSCCGMAGAFGYQAETFDVSMKMGEMSLFPAIRRAESGALIVADGTSCRQQIVHGTGRRALHVAQVLAQALPQEQEIGR